jgi:hypothetical protein
LLWEKKCPSAHTMLCAIWPLILCFISMHICHFCCYCCSLSDSVVEGFLSQLLWTYCRQFFPSFHFIWVCLVVAIWVQDEKRLMLICFYCEISICFPIRKFFCGKLEILFIFYLEKFLILLLPFHLFQASEMEK